LYVSDIDDDNEKDFSLDSISRSKIIEKTGSIIDNDFIENECENIENRRDSSDGKDDKKEYELRKRKTEDWSEEELTYLVHGVNSLGRNWSEIFQKYKRYFCFNRVRANLQYKYMCLEKSNNLNKYEKKAKLLKETDLVDLIDEKVKYCKWSEEEIIYLVYCVQQLGKVRWEKIFNKFKIHFDSDRRKEDLRNKFLILKKNNNLEYYEIKAKLLKENE
jgi:hypothetical protein